METGFSKSCKETLSSLYFGSVYMYMYCYLNDIDNVRITQETKRVNSFIPVDYTLST